VRDSQFITVVDLANILLPETQQGGLTKSFLQRVEEVL